MFSFGAQNPKFSLRSAQGGGTQTETPRTPHYVELRSAIEALAPSSSSLLFFLNNSARAAAASPRGNSKKKERTNIGRTPLDLHVNMRGCMFRCGRAGALVRGCVCVCGCVVRW